VQNRTRAEGELVVVTEPYSRVNSSLAPADRYGAGVAHQDLIEALLRYSSARLLILTAPFRGPVSFSEADERFQTSIDALRDEYGSHRILTGAASEVRGFARELPLVFVAAGTQAIPVGQARYNCRPDWFPVSTIIHSAHWPQMLLGFANLLLLHEPFDSVIVTSSAGKRAVETAWSCAARFLEERLGIPGPCCTPLRADLIPLGVDENAIRALDRGACRSRFGLPQDGFVVLYLGRVAEGHKADLEPLVTAFERFAQDVHGAHLVIAGQSRASSYIDGLKARIAGLRLDSQVTFITDFPYCDKSAIYSAADIFVSPADNIQETFGIAIVEAMAAGLPVVASDWSGYRDLVVDGETGMLVPTLWNERAAQLVSETPLLGGSQTAEHYLAQRTIVDVDRLYRSMRRLVDDRELRRSMGAAGRGRFERCFTWRRLIGNYLSLWQKQVDGLRCMASVAAAPRAKVSNNDLFAHYASASFDDGELIAGYHYDSLSAAIRRGRPPSGLISAAAPFLSEGCESVADAMAAAEEHLGMEAGDVVTWLLKKGLLESALSKQNDPGRLEVALAAPRG